MADEVSLVFLARQIERVLDRLNALEDQITVLTGMAMRHEGSLDGLVVEIRGLLRLSDRHERRLRKLEDESAK
jgi:hypothetical protein